ncbi:hypothetical protein Fleli_0595 [Bernardetia litoralis DSM 6794]|uniref:Uncharacterized protein n=1 Tax=Bernardetia litoralis (strain ATCC 23117 / DSM 6794 / NBRC 15988 / NCIMB 1366 / Fx l1 / Sio-4) TaxID=880071 RepID=I4AGH4_BERLS|nr:hypothetical protein [Bernardetia litoralis]AFM03059.1 hypothetical protein Fleli_0595 [Bernardetia litoralis DSM 6794]
MIQEIVAHEILQLITRKKPLWKWKKQCVYTDGIDRTFIKFTFFDENKNQIGKTCFQLETGIVQFSAITSKCSPTTLVDFLLEILDKTNK